MKHGLFLVDKPAGITSHDVVGRIRRVVKQRKVGHAGTLDPMASGLMLVACGEATKLLAQLTHQNKAYEAVLQLGVETDTLDADGQITNQRTVPHIDNDALTAVTQKFLGEIEQEVPKYSAIQVDGKRLYAQARAGVVFEAPTRKTYVKRLQVKMSSQPDRLHLDVEVGAGCYIRSLGRDVAKALGTVGHLVALRRTSVGPFDVAQACALSEAKESDLISMRTLMEWLPCLKVDLRGAESIRQGKAIAFSDVLEFRPAKKIRERTLNIDPHVYMVIDVDGNPVAWMTRTESGQVLRVLRGFQRESGCMVIEGGLRHE